MGRRHLRVKEGKTGESLPVRERVVVGGVLGLGLAVEVQTVLSRSLGWGSGDRERRWGSFGMVRWDILGVRR